MGIIGKTLNPKPYAEIGKKHISKYNYSKSELSLKVWFMCLTIENIHETSVGVDSNEFSGFCAWHLKVAKMRFQMPEPKPRVSKRSLLALSCLPRDPSEPPRGPRGGPEESLKSKKYYNLQRFLMISIISKIKSWGRWSQFAYSYRCFRASKGVPEMPLKGEDLDSGLREGCLGGLREAHSLTHLLRVHFSSSVSFLLSTGLRTSKNLGVTWTPRGSLLARMPEF